MFDRVQITWAQWTEVWRPPAPGDKPPRLGPAGAGLVLLPHRPERPEIPSTPEVPPVAPDVSPPVESNGERAPSQTTEAKV
jgi:hypothetical protein